MNEKYSKKSTASTHRAKEVAQTYDKTIPSQPIHQTSFGSFIQLVTRITVASSYIDETLLI